jgi:glycine cleavage system aminomethyltransferase T
MIDYLNELSGGFAALKKVKGYDVVDIANDERADYDAIRKGVGIFPFTFVSFFQVGSDDYEEKLDGLLTKSIQYLNYGQNRTCYILNDQGDIDAMVTVYKNDEDYYLEVFSWDEEKVAQVLADSDVVYEKRDFSCILLEGATTVEFIAEVLDLTVDYFVYQSHQEVDCFGQDIIVARTGYTGEYGYKLIGRSDVIKDIWSHILPAHKDKISGYTAFSLCQYEIKQPTWELPYLEINKNIFEIDYQWLVDFKKDIDYVGKEALYSDRSQSVSSGTIGALGDKALEVGTAVLLEGERIGEVIDSKFSYGLDTYIHILLVNKEYAQANIPLQTEAGDEIATTSAPYVLPASWTAAKSDSDAEQDSI